MKVIKPNRLSCLFRPYRYLNNDYFAVTAYVLLDFSSGFSIGTEQDLWTLFKEESVLNFGAEALDFGVPKGKPEIILNAYGYGKYGIDGRTAVSISVNNVRKDLWVTGDRYWSDGKPSKAIPFERIAINWANAYGGPGFEENPVGKGYTETAFNGLAVRWLPNIEDPNHPVLHERQRYTPAGYAAIPIESPGRNRLLGTYDEQWRTNEFPGFARDIDWEYFNQSPARQRLNRLEAEDEIVFTHMHPEKAELTTRIPPIVVKAFIKRNASVADKTGFLEAVPMKMTTYWAYPHVERAVLIYQGVIAINEYDASDVSHLLYAVEHQQYPQEQTCYEEVFHQRTDPKSGAFYAMLDKQLVDARFICRSDTDQIEVSPLLRNKMKKLEREIATPRWRVDGAATRERALEAGQEKPAWFKHSRDGKVWRDDIIEEMLAQQQQEAGIDAVKAEKKRLKQNLSKLRKKENDVPQETLDRRKQFLAQRREAFMASIRADVDKHVETVAGIQAANSDDAVTQLRRMRQRQVEQFEELVSKNPKRSTAKRDWSGKAVKRYPIYGLSQFDSGSAPEGYDGYVLCKFSATGTSYAAWILNGLFVRESQVFECDFSQSSMALCDIEETIFKGCDFSSANWDQAHFRNCRFINCRMGNIQTDKAVFENCQFIDSTVSIWMHFKVAMKNCTFERCQFANFSFTRAALENLNFDKCHFLRHAFVKGKAKNLRFKDCHIDSMGFVGMKAIDGMEISQSKASKLFIAPDTAVQGMKVSYSKISASSFRKLVLDESCFIASDLSTCDFSEASMKNSVMADSFFKQCLFIRSDLSQATVGNSDFSEAQLGAADLTMADLTHVSFFCADLSNVKTSGKLRQHDMLMDRANLYPLRK